MSEILAFIGIVLFLMFLFSVSPLLGFACLFILIGSAL